MCAEADTPQLRPDDARTVESLRRLAPQGPGFTSLTSSTRSGADALEAVADCRDLGAARVR